MSKKEFLEELSKHLKRLDNSSKLDIISEYESHFSQGLKEGRLEPDISKKLGDPKRIAKELYAIEQIKSINFSCPKKSIFKLSTTIISLSFINILIFIILSSLIVLTLPIWLGILIATPFFISSPIFIIVTGFMYGFDFINFIDVIKSFVLCILGLISLTLIYKAAKKLPNIIFRYLKWNLTLIK